VTTNNGAMVPGRQTADERRATVLAAAVTEFARSGYAGTSTEAIAQRAGISQPYLFRLFGTKKDLFVATYDLVADGIVRTMTAACGDRTGEEAIAAMGSAYLELMQDPDVLQVQLHGFAAAPGDPDIAQSCRRTFEVLWNFVHDRTGMPDDEIRTFFSMGMMINVMSAIDLLSVSDHWAQSLCPEPEKALAIVAAAKAAAATRQAAHVVEPEEVPA
jgi:AcrR family transcriptional regulator